MKTTCNMFLPSPTLATVCGVATLLLGGVLIAGCAGGASDSPASPAAEPSSASPEAVADALQRQAGDQALVGQFDVRIDGRTMHATVTPVEARSGQAQPPQALTYDLDIDRFLNKNGFRIKGLETNTDGDLKLTFTHEHPFPAPNFAGAITASNRADLGYTGRVIIYANGTTTSFFNDTVLLDPTYVLDPDGYLNPGDLLAGSLGANNVFPFVLLADEALNNRIEADNGGNMTGNYLPGQAGWARSNAGSGGNSWTGYDFIHGGQTIENSFILSKDALGVNQVANFRVGMLIKYTDPRGVAGRSMRFPPEPPSATDFAYRLPFAALDGSVIQVQPDLRIKAEPGEPTVVTVDVRDWDAAGNEAATSDLSSETNVSLVPPGTAGAGTLRIDLPMLFSSPAEITSAIGSGLPGDLLRYSGTVQPDLFPDSGPVLGLVEVVDPEEQINDSSYHFGVDPLTLSGDPNRALALRTYQTLPTTIWRNPPQITSVEVVGNVSREEATFTATVLGSTPNEWEWDFGGGVYPNLQNGASPFTTLLGKPGDHTGTLTVRNADGEDSFDFDFTAIPKTIGLDMYLVHSGATYPDLWPGMTAWTEQQILDYFVPRFNDVYQDAGIFLDRDMITITEIDNPAIFNIDSGEEEDEMFGILLGHTKTWPQFMILNENNATGWAGVMSDQSCDWDNAGRGCVVTAGYGEEFTKYLHHHELGHVFSLPHIRTASPITDNNYNLMSYGTSSTVLFEDAHREAGRSCNTHENPDHNQFAVSHDWVHDYLP